MRLSKIEVKKLFGVFDHTINLRRNDRITIIHGPNGFGKTAILLLVQSLLSARFARLRRVPFQRFALSFEDGRELSVEKENGAVIETGKENKTMPLHFRFSGGGQSAEGFDYVSGINKDSISFPVEIIDRHIDDLERVGSDVWLQTSTGRLLDIEDVLDIYEDFLPMARQPGKSAPEWLSKLSSEFEIRLIEAQRLLSFLDTRKGIARRPDLRQSLEPAVSLYAKELVANMQEVQAKYGTHSQQLDSTFPARVIQLRSAPSVTVEDLKTKLLELENKRQRIIAAGLLSTEPPQPPSFGPGLPVEEATKSILALYAEDFDSKLRVFDAVTEKIELFKEMLNKRFSYKQLDVERRNGFQVTTSTGLRIPPTDLSSGEQHELVLFYELLFKTKPNSLILIDEPELSLHVAWQVEFLNDLSRVIKLVPFDVLLATHSPQIINDRWDLTEELKGLPPCSNT